MTAGFGQKTDESKASTEGQAGGGLARHPVVAAHGSARVIAGEPGRRADLLERTDGQCLLYPGLIHSFHGEPESGKSLIMQAEAAVGSIAASTCSTSTSSRMRCRSWPACWSSARTRRRSSTTSTTCARRSGRTRHRGSGRVGGDAFRALRTGRDRRGDRCAGHLRLLDDRQR